MGCVTCKVTKCVTKNSTINKSQLATDSTDTKIYEIFTPWIQFFIFIVSFKNLFVKIIWFKQGKKIITILIYEIILRANSGVKVTAQ